MHFEEKSLTRQPMCSQALNVGLHSIPLVVVVVVVDHWQNCKMSNKRGSESGETGACEHGPHTHKLKGSRKLAAKT